MPGLTLETQVSQEQEVFTTDISNVREEIIRVKDVINREFMRLARMLFDVHQNELYLAWGYTNFESYVKGELDYSYRKAAYLVDMWGKLRGLRINAERIEAIGWTKCVELARVITQEDAHMWLDRAESMSYRQLLHEVKKVVDQTYEDSRPHYTLMKLRFDNADIRPVTDALEEAKRIFQTNDIALAISQICMEWMQLQGKVPTASNLDDYIVYLKKVFNVALVPTPVDQVPNADLLEVEEVEQDSKIYKPAKRVEGHLRPLPAPVREREASQSGASLEDILGEDDFEISPEQANEMLDLEKL